MSRQTSDWVRVAGAAQIRFNLVLSLGHDWFGCRGFLAGPSQALGHHELRGFGRWATAYVEGLIELIRGCPPGRPSCSLPSFIDSPTTSQAMRAYRAALSPKP